MTTLANLHRFSTAGHQVVVVQPSEFHYYSGMGPGMLGGTYEPEDIRFNTRKIVEKQGGTFRQGTAVEIDRLEKRVTLQDSQSIGYDLLSCNVGSFVPLASIEGKEASMIPVKPIEQLVAARKMIVERLRSSHLNVAVIGGGPSAVEIAGNLRQLGNNHRGHSLKITLFGGRNLLSGTSEWLQKQAAEMLASRNIILHLGKYVTEVANRTVTTDDGSKNRFDLIFAAIGVTPSTLFNDSGFDVEEGGGLKVNAFLQSVDSADIFGGGDCIHFIPSPLDKVGVYAVRQNSVLLSNLLASLSKQKLQPFKPGKKYLLIYNLGNGQGIFKKGVLRFSGSLAFKIKDHIDRKFINRFKILEA